MTDTQKPTPEEIETLKDEADALKDRAEDDGILPDEDADPAHRVAEQEQDAEPGQAAEQPVLDPPADQQPGGGQHDRTERRLQEVRRRPSDHSVRCAGPAWAWPGP